MQLFIKFCVLVFTCSPTLGHPLPFKTLLGGVTFDQNSTIVSAKALLSLYMVHINFSTVNMDEVGNDGGTADWVSSSCLSFFFLSLFLVLFFFFVLLHSLEIKL